MNRCTRRTDTSASTRPLMQTGSMFSGEISTFASASCGHTEHKLATGRLQWSHPGPEQTVSILHLWKECCWQSTTSRSSNSTASRHQQDWCRYARDDGA